jgi:hypothetical protein
MQDRKKLSFNEEIFSFCLSGTGMVDFYTCKAFVLFMA